MTKHEFITLIKGVSYSDWPGQVTCSPLASWMRASPLDPCGLGEMEE